MDVFVLNTPVVVHSDTLNNRCGLYNGVSKVHRSSTLVLGLLPVRKFLYLNIFPFYFRDRIIHLLALRPYKKPELLARLQRGK